MNKQMPLDGFKGFKAHFKDDVNSGLLVFLLALPLSLGIARASEFPPVMGLVTAIIGGILVSFFMGSRLTIKGPAAGLIVIVAGAVTELGQGDLFLGWKYALGVMVVSGLVQIAFGLFKFGKYIDFFPLSAVRGMLAAIGLIIIIKQIPVLLNVDPNLHKGEPILQMLVKIPFYFTHANMQVAWLGIASLLIMMLWSYIPFKKATEFPPALVVLLFVIPTSIMLNFETSAPEYALLKIGSLTESFGIHASFDGWSQTTIFIKYVVMLALVGSLESLLTVKAVDGMDPYNRTSDVNKDLMAVGLGNTVAAFLGGLPMIAEVARSSANVANGAKTRWANFYHGAFMLIFLLLAIPLLEKIPNAALAAMLIAVGIRLSHPREFIKAKRIGNEQLGIFTVTIFFTLYQDLLVGIFAGMVFKVIANFYHGVSLSQFFKAEIYKSVQGQVVVIELSGSAVFSNYLQIKEVLDRIPHDKILKIDVSQCRLIDHTVMSSLNDIKKQHLRKYNADVQIVGLEQLKPLAEHELSARQAM
jgi:MFS superfamily sulfate permease-like transporter